ncbi:uncharacterized protein K452DRAFT_235408 [Aplosporella prunicola CBS 121167]|uniref:Uncharacterized protein n=1 Tax=Aplosporella prunicola CBS 121167 TaxID=1176127 RepID=A0A6A6B0V3_9PEZI|nr:uncharacterized protein K452DRAFT_235408 [Aplosporella prunicola CBS 121167]KAF2137799.1 hypothetical protein K452DRAFT_235408 [Aplosporella prunicola CBS 121167]
MNSLPITGNVLKRFVQAAVLLHSIDPVRGEPIAYSLDQDSHELAVSRESLLKRKFLDSVALICATKKDAGSVSAACIEEGHPDGTVLRIASNAGVRNDVLSQIQELVGLLNDLSRTGEFTTYHNPIDEKDILLCIIRLDMSKIRVYLKTIADANIATKYTISTVEASLENSSEPSSGQHTLQHFLDWFEHVYKIDDAPSNSKPESLLQHLAWAQEARKYSSDFLKQMFPMPGHWLPRWICCILKLGRYSIAAKAMTHLATEFPSLFNPMTVEPVVVPETTAFTPPTGDSLQCVLRRIAGHHADEYISRLGRIWNTTDAEHYFLRACSRKLTVHAEIQLLNFYDHNKQLKPLFHFIGYKGLINNLRKIMEAAANQDLEGRLGSRRRTIPADSTAGVSLTGLIIVTPTRPTTSNLDLARREQSVPTSVASEVDISSLDNSLHRGEPDDRLVLATSGNPPDGRSQQTFPSVTSLQFVSIAIHFMRADDPTRQDIICVRDLISPLTNVPSWGKLISILATEHKHGLSFKEDQDYLMVDGRIRVADERQFLACLQYQYNLNILSFRAYVHRFPGPKAVQPISRSVSICTAGEQEKLSKKRRIDERDVM